MSTSHDTIWRAVGGALSRRFARSSWRLLALLILVALVGLLPPYLLRGNRGLLLVVLGATGAVASAVCFANPFWTVMATLVVLYSGIDLYLPGPVTWALLALAAARACFDVLDGKKLDWGTPTFRLALSVLLAVCLTSLVVARNMGPALFQIRILLEGLALYVVVTMYVNSSQRIVVSLFAVSVALSVAAVLQTVPLLAKGPFQFLIFLSGERFAILGTEPNISAVHSNCMLLPTLYLLGHTHGWRRLALFPVLLLLIASIVLSASRAGMAVMGIVFLMFLLREQRYRGYALLFLAGAGALVALVPKGYWVRFVSIGQLGGIVVDRSLQLRQHVLEVGWRVFVEHPWLGVGLGNFPIEASRFMSVELMAHNTYVEVAASLGLFGIMAYLLWLFSGLGMVARARGLWRTEARQSQQSLAETIGLSLVVYCIAGLSLSIPFYLMLWFLLGLANAARLCAESGAD